ncbi:MAG: M48 family metalloprotease [Nodosilinea sp.]
MVQPLNPQHQAAGAPPTPASTDDTEALYQQGVAAFKAEDYGQALFWFQHLDQRVPKASASGLKAQMGLVRVHQRLGNGTIVRELCEAMAASPVPQARQWASQVLSQLPAAVAHSPTLSDHHNLDPAGADPAAPAEDQSGFVPFDVTPAQSLAAPAAQPSSDAQTLADCNPGAASGSPAVSQPAVQGDPLADHTSLFHYQQLNHGLTTPHPQGTPSPRPALATSRQDGSAVNSSTFLGSPTSPAPSSTRSISLPGPQRLYPLWLTQLVTAVVAVGAIHWGIHLGLRSLNELIRLIHWPVRLSGIPGFDQAHPGLIVALALLLGLGSPWLMDLTMAGWYRQRSLTTRQLQAQSPEALRLLRQVCRQRGWQLPELRLVPDPVPLCFSYGWRPKNTRIVVSQGLLDGLSEDELAALYGYELSHMANGDLPVISALGLLLLVLYTGYGQLARWGNTLPIPLARGLIGILAHSLYGLFWLLRKLVLWLSRVRSQGCDLRSVELTQKPVPQQHGLLGLTQSMATHVQQHGSLHPLLDSLGVLMPLDPHQAVSPGSFLPTVGLETVVAADCRSPYRRWLMANSSHRPLGERLMVLNHQAELRHQPTLNLEFQLGENRPQPSPEGLSLPRLLVQKSPLVGLMAGGGIALGLWFIGGLVNRLGWYRLSWLYQDPSILRGGLLLGLGLGLLLQINTLYPDINRRTAPLLQAGPELFTQSVVLPVEGRPLRLQGKLVGPMGLANGFCQTLYLDCQGGLIKLATVPLMAGIQGLIHPQHHPAGWVGRPVEVAGWQRRGGGLLWVEVAEIRLGAQHGFRGRSPLWATGLSLALSLAGIATLFTGG